VFTYFWTWFTWLIVWLCQETCVQMLSSFMSAGKYVADRFQPSLSRLSRRATLPLCRQRSGLFSRDHWKDRIVCRSWSMCKCRQQHFPSKVMGSQGNACGSTIGTKWNWTLACLLTSTHWYTLHWKHKSGSPERPRNAFHCCACNQVRPSEPTCFPCVEFTSRPTVAGIGLGAEKLEGAHSFFSTAWGTSI
jgi:hypothetical protein